MQSRATKYIGLLGIDEVYTSKSTWVSGKAETHFEINLTPVERILRRTPLVAAGEYRCSVENPQFAGGGPEKCPFIVFSRSSVRLIPSRGEPMVCTPNTVNLLDVGDSYDRRPVSKEGAICDWIAVAPALLREIAEYVDPASTNRMHIFNRAVVPLAPKTFLAQRNFFRSLQLGAPVPQLAIEESAMRLVERVLTETSKFSRASPSFKEDGHKLASARRREMVEETKCILAREYWAQISVSDLAKRVHCSPSYLSRSFSKLSGFTLHGYQQQLRLRAALQLLSDARFNGAGIALQLGFANHSHFSDVFGAQFGITPTVFAKTYSRASLENMNALLGDN